MGTCLDVWLEETLLPELVRRRQLFNYDGHVWSFWNWEVSPGSILPSGNDSIVDRGGGVNSSLRHFQRSWILDNSAVDSVSAAMHQMKQQTLGFEMASEHYDEQSKMIHNQKSCSIICSEGARARQPV
jgi:hypothetical protein